MSVRLHIDANPMTFYCHQCAENGTVRFPCNQAGLFMVMNLKPYFTRNHKGGEPMGPFCLNCDSTDIRRVK